MIDGDFLTDVMIPILSKNISSKYAPNGRIIIGMVKIASYKIPSPGAAQKGKVPIADEVKQYVKRNSLLLEGRIPLKPK